MHVDLCLGRCTAWFKSFGTSRLLCHYLGAFRSSISPTTAQSYVNELWNKTSLDIEVSK